MCEGALHRPEGLGVPGQLDVEGVAVLVAWREGVAAPEVNDLVGGRGAQRLEVAARSASKERVVVIKIKDIGSMRQTD